MPCTGMCERKDISGKELHPASGLSTTLKGLSRSCHLTLMRQAVGYFTINKPSGRLPASRNPWTVWRTSFQGRMRMT